jgi:ribulose-5-phosphate 4-epimerase/fuculose-1-phosphate aldolase
MYRKRQLAAAFRVFAKYDLDEGRSGHITVRDPEVTDAFWMNPVDVPFAHLCVSDLQLIGIDGTMLEGNRPVQLAGFAIHSQLYAENPQISSAAHSHSLYGKALSSLGRLLDPITQDACHFFGCQVLFDEYDGAVVDLDEGRKIARIAGNNKLIILQNHGFLSLGTSVDEAAWYFLHAERAAYVQLLADAAGTPILVARDVAEKMATLSRYGGAPFQHYYQRVVREQPDLLE